MGSTYTALIAAIDQMSRAQRDTGAYLSRAVDCGSGGLAALRVLEHGARQIGELAHALRVDVSVASRQVGALADAGLVERDVAAGDRRGRTVALTDAGRALAARHALAAQELAREMFADWSDDEIDTAAQQFLKVADAVRRHSDLLSTPAARAATPSPEREIA